MCCPGFPVMSWHAPRSTLIGEPADGANFGDEVEYGVRLSLLLCTPRPTRTNQTRRPK